MRCLRVSVPLLPNKFEVVYISGTSSDGLNGSVGSCTHVHQSSVRIPAMMTLRHYVEYKHIFRLTRSYLGGSTDHYTYVDLVSGILLISYSIILLPWAMGSMDTLIILYK